MDSLIKYKNYFETIARSLNSISHTDADKHFESIHSSALFNGVQFKIKKYGFFLENYSSGFKDENGNLSKMPSGAFSIIKQVSGSGNYDEMSNAMAWGEAECMKVLAKIKQDKKDRVFDVIGFDFNTVECITIDNMPLGWYGMRVSFELPTPTALCYDESQWLSNPELAEDCVCDPVSSGLESTEEFEENDKIYVIRDRKTYLYNANELGGSGSADNIVIDASSDILASDSSTYFDLKGNDLNKITTILIQDAAVTDFLLVNYDLLRVYLNTTTIGKKDMTINGTIYPLFINVQVNAGFTYLGSDDGFSFSHGTEITDDIEVFNNSYPPIQDALGVKPTYHSSSNYGAIKLNNFKFRGDQEVEIIFDWCRKTTSSENLYLACINSDFNIKTTTGITMLYKLKRGLRILKDSVSAVAVNVLNHPFVNRVGINDAMPISHDTNLPTDTDSLCLKYVMNNEGLLVYNLKNRYDTKGFLLFQYISPTIANLDPNVYYSPVINIQIRYRTNIRIQAIRITG